MMKDSDTLLVGYDKSHGDIAILIIGRRNFQTGKTDIVHKFQGNEAKKLYTKLVGGENDGRNEHEN